MEAQGGERQCMSSVVGEIEPALEAEGYNARILESDQTRAEQPGDLLSFRRFCLELSNANQIVELFTRQDRPL